MNIFNKLVWTALSPVVILAAGLFVTSIKRKWRFHNVLILVLCLAYYCLCSGWFFRIVGGGLEREYEQRSPRDYPNADAIVILGGGVGCRLNNKTSVPELASSADRDYLGALLWKANRAPIVITSCTGAERSDNVFLSDLGVPKSAIVTEANARNTEENAKFIQKLLNGQEKDESRKKRILLVTSAWHMKRSLYMFEKYAPDVECIPAACDYEVMTRGPLNFTDFIPDASAFELNSRFLHEWLGIIGYHFRR